MKENTIVTANTIDAQGMKLVDKYFKAIDSAKKSAWNVAKVVSDTVNDAKFEQHFGSLSTYADAIKMSKSSVSIMNRAYLMYNDFPCLDGFTYTAVAAMLTLPLEYGVEKFLTDYSITSETPVSDVKKAVASVKAIETEDEPESGENDAEIEATEGTDESDVVETNAEEVEEMVSVPNVDLVLIDGKMWELTPEDVAAIKEVLGL